MATPTACAVTSRLIFSITGFLVGLSVFCVFGFHFHNWNTALWGLVSGLAASISIYIHFGYQRQIFAAYPYTLQRFMLTGCFIQLAGVCGFVVYLVLGITQHQGLVVYGEGYFLTCVWCAMTWKWGFFLLIYARMYKRVYISECTILTPHADPSCQQKSYVTVYQ
ncbi:hypothetical protein LOTGIDRAFT_235195 [Lottia gigantea]|uniref:Heme transporter hrg1-A n=1 Tax=Lottia gigantea TaxID=225164 RepID=V3ZW02_LOTGI|nr:hypothetical protein LOTGIDRAFT_235195 [Lottia gigantea]ESO86790.1 hypothetical protein LOTGIDRAFT_235195 [Lottia gigantea]